MPLYSEEQRPFIEAILEDPDDLTGYLVYADWMEEQGNPQAELIRVQCQKEMIDRTSPEMLELQNHERRLLAEHATEWLGDIAPYFDKKGHSRFATVEHAFRRGFLDEIHLREHVGRFGKQLARSECVLFLRRLWFELSENVNLPRWFGFNNQTTVEFPNMRRMTLLGNYEAGDLDVVLHAMPRLEYLDLRTIGFSTTELLSVPMSRLRFLRIHRVHIDAEALFRNPSLTNLESLEVQFESVPRFEDAVHLSSLRTMVLHIPNGDRTIQRILQSPLSQSVETLDLTGSDVTGSGLTRLLDAGHTIRHVEIGGATHRVNRHLLAELSERGIAVNP